MKRNNKVLPKPLALAFTITVILAIPLPFALYLGGIDWIISGSHAGLKEFVISYLVGLLVLCGGLAITIFKDRREKRNRKLHSPSQNNGKNL
ncbi:MULTISPECIES: hypothetical protein [Arcanobacterium]|uniref:Uncharacterized protein n=1 Tax=Arcanobacterium pinnipediorum TaxID=1503041 RepID=A0ABY5AIA9_9ACTO|nr:MULTISPECIES: hypothetical protein [Arcanobacterium]USR79944.1 hypothetical protein NG665_02905 [Arcanobacterium pinnipediorum]